MRLLFLFSFLVKGGSVSGSVSARIWQKKRPKKKQLLFPISPRGDELLVEPYEQHERPKRDRPAQQHAGYAERPAQTGHGEGEREDPGADHRGEVVLVQFCFLFFFFRVFRF